MLGESDPTAPIIPGNPFTLPPPGIPDRGSTVKDLTLIPKPIAPSYAARTKAQTATESRSAHSPHLAGSDGRHAALP